MRTYDLSPLFRSTVGFDHMNRLIAAATNNEVATYPPYNIEKSSDDDYRVTMAVAGFSVDDLEITQKENALFIKGKITAETDDIKYLHRGIAARTFERRFALADHVNVSDAALENGILVVDLKREVPEALKPRRFYIKDVNNPTEQINEQAA
ncbi:MAG: heat-shock protein [Alphaproteobacteria bacterium]|jgi:molecular chaperone IbpA|nr:heat-shock protein [Alphaproteobacteria bacterium]PPR14622.1 MAG: Small heat shock protein IbpA [Alphaproteobacteria bacterium MarineAlpha12_Bin1]|tara:strand:- start:6634 stop:7089 length:456 start_codon:yes stop_codon:yes gene_type:complete